MEPSVTPAAMEMIRCLRLDWYAFSQDSANHTPTGQLWSNLSEDSEEDLRFDSQHNHCQHRRKLPFTRHATPQCTVRLLHGSHVAGHDTHAELLKCC